jgi:hypothetical protein
MKVKKFTEYIKEDDSTSASFGSGTAVGTGSAVGSFVSANGVSMYGGDSGTAFATNSSINGMGNIVSAQPSPIPGDVAGGTKGSGDLSGGVLSTSTKIGAVYRKVKTKKGEKMKKTKAENKLNNLIVKFNDFDATHNVKENVYIEPEKIICDECGEEVESDLHDMIGHLRNKHNIKNIDLDDHMLRKYFSNFYPDIKKD